jgi:hypothetical protein
VVRGARTTRGQRCQNYTWSEAAELHVVRGARTTRGQRCQNYTWSKVPELHVVQYSQRGLWCFVANYELVTKNKHGGVFPTRTYHILEVQAIGHWMSNESSEVQFDPQHVYRSISYASDCSVLLPARLTCDCKFQPRTGHERPRGGVEV